MLEMWASAPLRNLRKYRDLYGENNDHFCKNVAISIKLSLPYFSLVCFLSCVVFDPIYGHSNSFGGTCRNATDAHLRAWAACDTDCYVDYT